MMEKTILVLVGIALGIALILLLLKGPEPKSEVLVVGASAKVASAPLSPPQGLKRAAGEVAPRPSVVYPNASMSLQLHKPAPELNGAASMVLPSIAVTSADRGAPYALEEPSTSLLQWTRSGPSISHPDAASVFTLERAPEELLSAAAQVKAHPSVEGAHAGIMSLSPPLGLLEEGE